VQHGHKRNAALPVHVRFELYADRLEVRVRDTGGGFDLSRVTPDVTVPEHLFDARGRGIFIMRACCDTVDYEFGKDGTVCHLVKFRPAPPARAADV
jgi:anti-sigma regulatory factor (Ser/Thr protein kinase)